MFPSYCVGQIISRGPNLREIAFLILSSFRFKPTIWLECVKDLICLHWTEILYKSKIADLAKEFSSTCFVIKLKTSAFKKLNLVGN